MLCALCGECRLDPESGSKLIRRHHYHVTHHRKTKLVKVTKITSVSSNYLCIDKLTLTLLLLCSESQLEFYTTSQFILVHFNIAKVCVFFFSQFSQLSHYHLIFFALH